MTMPNSSSEDEVAMAAPAAVALKATRFVQTECCLLASVEKRISVHRTLSPFRFSRPRMEGGCAIGLRGFFTFQRAHVTKTSVGRTKTTTFRRVRSSTTHAGNLPTKERVMRLPSRIRQNVIFPKKASTLTSRASAVHLWSWRRGRNSTISGFLRSFWMFAMCSVSSSKAKDRCC